VAAGASGKERLRVTVERTEGATRRTEAEVGPDRCNGVEASCRHIVKVIVAVRVRDRLTRLRAAEIYHRTGDGTTLRSGDGSLDGAICRSRHNGGIKCPGREGSDPTLLYPELRIVGGAACGTITRRGCVSAPTRCGQCGIETEQIQGRWI